MPTTQNTDFNMYAVRPTTPMGPVSSSTQGYIMTGTSDFPKTTLLLMGSGAVITVIAICVVWMFCCKQSHTPLDSKPPPSAIAAGYAPIPSEPSPPDPRCFQTNTTANGNCNGNTMSNGVSAPLLLQQPPPERKKDFKEWYV